MSDETQKQEPDNSEPTPERQTELRAAYEWNVNRGRPPYEGVRLHTLGEVQWVLSERGWSGEWASSDRANLRGADFQAANLKGLHLIRANLHDATFYRANLQDALLNGANLSGTNLYEANLRGAVLVRAQMDARTSLTYVALDSTTWLGDIVWNGASLTLTDWNQIPRLGDEIVFAEEKSRYEMFGQSRTELCRVVARAYRGLAKALHAQGLEIPALRYRTREQQLERKALFWSVKPGQWVFSWLLNLVSGYGDRPGRALACYVGVVSFFAATYYAITNGLLGIGSQSTPLRWYEALVLSISSFHGRGFFPSVPTLGDPIAIVAAAEAIIGLFIELVFIATFTQRFFAR